MKSLLKRMFLIGCGLLFAFVLGILSTYVLWLEPFAVALVAFSSRFVLRLFHISKPGGLFFAMLSAMGTSIESKQKSTTDQKHTFQQRFHRYVLIIEKSKDP